MIQVCEGKSAINLDWLVASLFIILWFYLIFLFLNLIATINDCSWSA